MRLQGLDIFRGYAIFLMVSYHFCFDLNNFHIFYFDFHHSLFWKYFRYLIVSIFVYSSGIALFLVHKDGIDFKKVKKRVFILSSASLLVSVGSYTQFPDTWIYFGILHFFLFSSLFGLFFLKFPKIAIFMGIFILTGFNFSFLTMHWLYNLLQAPLSLPLYYTEDLANIVPWFGVFLLGIASAYYGLEYKLFNNGFFNKKGNVNMFFSFLGRNTLLIYLLHQPLLFGFFYLRVYLPMM